MSASLSIAFIGTGVMGRSMAGHLQKAGHPLHVYNRTKDKAAALLEAGIAPDTEVCFHGGLRALGPRELRDDPRRDNRCETLSTAMGKSLNQAVRDYLEQLAGRAQMESDLQAFMDSAQQTPGRLNGWKFDREELHRRA